MMMQPQPPSAQSGESYQKMAARIPTMSDEQLQTFVNTGFGALALTEISRRNRIEMQKQAANAAMQGGGTIADAEIQKRAQAKMAERLAGDDRMGLNNIVAQAEQGGLEFGQPARGMAGGGMVAFSDGAYPVDDYSSMFYMQEPEKEGRSLAEILKELGRDVVEGVGPSSIRDIRKEAEAEAERRTSELANRDLVRKSEADMRSAPGEPTPKAAPKLGKGQQAGIQSLFTTDPSKILEDRKKLMAAQGIGEFGADVEEMLGESESKAMKGLEGLKLARAATAGAKAVGGRGRERKTGLEALAAAVSGAAEGAGSVAERELEAQTKFDEFRMKQAMAKDAYDRGEVGKAQELAMSAQKDQRDYNLKKEELDILRSYRDAQGQAAMAKASQQYGVKPGDVVSAVKQSDLLRQRLAMLDPEDEVNAAEIQQITQDLQMLKAIAGMGTIRGMGLQIQDVPDEE